MTDRVNELASEQSWILKPSLHQPRKEDVEWTNHRKLPLPYAIDVVIDGETYACRYCGHGQSKVAYTFIHGTETRVLKLTETYDHEPYVCEQLSRLVRAAQPAIKICPTVYQIGRCQEQDQRGNRTREWFAWTAEYAIALNKYMQRPNVECEACLKIALYKQVIAGQHGLLLSDNNLFNFGVVDDTVVIIDMGSRALEPQAMAKSRMTKYAMKEWWKKLKWQCKDPQEYAECRTIWQEAYHLDDVAQKLCNTRLCHGSNSAEQPAPGITETPAVWMLLEGPSDSDDVWANNAAAEWLFVMFLGGEEGEEQPPHIRLETTIKVTRQRRSMYTRKPDEILPPETLKRLLDEWKADYKAWMNQSSQDAWRRLPSKKDRHEYERTRFRTFLFKMCGCYQLVMFWLRVPASRDSLSMFQKACAHESIAALQEEAAGQKGGNRQDREAKNAALLKRAVEGYRSTRALAMGKPAC